MSDKKYILYIFHRDLRLYDNETLRAAAANAKTLGAQIIPAFIFTPAQVSNKLNTYKSHPSVQFMVQSLEELDSQLREAGAPGLSLFHGDNDKVVYELLTTLPVKAIYETADYTPFAKQRQEQMLGLSTLLEVEYNLIHDTYLTEPGTVLNKSKKPFQKFTPFYETARRHPVPAPQPAPAKIAWCPQKHGNFSFKEAHDLYTKKKNIAVNGGREEAKKLLAHLPDNYDKEKDIPSISTSLLSAHHHYGTISIRESYHAAKKHPHMKEFVRQLYWRDFYGQITDAFEELYGESPYTFQHDKSAAKGRWNYDRAAFNRWATGKTGVPMVDAAMKQLLETGYMHNRARLIAANYLVKTMKVFWRWGEAHFARHLVDYDFAQNFGNWSWVASVLPYSQAPFRSLDAETQQKKVDPEHAYTDKWLPQPSKA
jgi:deoxyribodipyrimidine photo-lyase